MRDRYIPNISIIIPAAGIGKRMTSKGAKSLIKITPDITIIDYQLNILTRKFDNAEIILVSGFESEKVMNHVPDNIINIENERFTETNVLKSIGIGLRAARSPHVLIVYGDIIFNKHFLDKIDLTKTTLFIDKSDIMGKEEVGCTINDNKVDNMEWDLPNKWAQISYFTGKELKLLQSIAWNKDKEKWYGFEAINQIINKGGKFQVQYGHGARDVDYITDIDIARTLI